MTQIATPILIRHYPTLNDSVNVYREENMLIAHVGDPIIDGYFNQPFREVKFVRPNGKIFTNSIFDGRVCRELMDDGTLAEGNTVKLKFQISPVFGWIKTIDGKNWH